ncbi:MAG: PqqD family protein [Actinobacteria bacterium]|nr:PqqD family protein [Actinomycetota bacterium]
MPDSIGPPAASVRALELDGEISLYDAASQHALLLNGTASDIWRLADGQRNLAQIVAMLAATYGTAETVIRADVERTIAELVAAGFLPA